MNEGVHFCIRFKPFIYLQLAVRKQTKSNSKQQRMGQNFLSTKEGKGAGPPESVHY